MTEESFSYPILDNLSGPEELKTMSIEDLEAVAAEARQRIIQVMSVNGGHLASSLGAVDLIIALHHVFNSPQDKLVWDVGHQTYAHKLVTGRHHDFDSVRQTNGLCGFTHPKESVHDHFHAGHAGTALSLALGLAKNRDLNNNNDYVIPIIGDATLSCGMTLEALNNISRDLKKFIVILNDNKMSISKNVGQIAGILSRMLSNPTSTKLYQEIDSLISKIPGYGSLLSKQGHRVTESIKNLVSPAAFFEHFGLSYIGPVDGHDIRKLVTMLEGVKNSSWPVIIHCITKKGQGLDVAMENPTTWHGAKPFNVETCSFIPNTNTKPSLPKVFGNHLVEMAKKDSSIVAVTPAMIAGSCLDKFAKTFPNRCIDVGIAEGHSVTFSGGIAYGGDIKVFASIYSSFLQRAFDNLFLDVCLEEIPVVFAIDRAGIAAGDGATHQGIYDIAWLNAMPNMVISQPRNGHVLKELMESAHDWQRPAAIRYPNVNTEESMDLPIKKRILGKGEILSQGSDILLLSLGVMTETALEIKKILSASGYNATVVDPIFVKPLDTDLLCDLLLTHTKVVTIEEHVLSGGFGSIVNNFLLSNGFNNLQVLNCAIPDSFVDHGSREDILELMGLTAEKIVLKMTKAFNLRESLQPQEVLK